ncbi:MAG: Glyoxylase, beta-lactamase superfamily [Chitinophagaceae bacterium]|nr:Glyoxylase, beta-lactamase superfamily [Chitinophagaceae bacterium]
MNKSLFVLLAILIVSIHIAAQKTPAYEIYALKYATLANPTPVSAWVLNGPDKDSVEIIFMYWLIKDNLGRNILVDAGCSNDLQAAKDFGVYKFTRPDSILLQTGLKAADITDIIVTHPHWDHIDGISLFPNAHIWIQKQDYNYFVGEAWQKDGNHGGFVKRDILQLVDLNVSGKVTLVDGDDKEIIPGIKVYTGSRHTYNSQYVLVQSGNDKVIIASDNIWVYYSLEKMLPAPSYGTFDAKGYVAAMQRMKTLASKIDFIIPGHDAQLFAKFPKISADVIRIK